MSDVLWRTDVESLKPIRLSERVCEVLKKLIAEEGFKPGDRFYSESELTKKLQVSRSSIREAVRILEATGWVKVEHGKGIFVSDSSYQGFDAFSNWLKDNQEGILEHFEVRLMIDPKAAAYAARNAEEEDASTLESICAEFKRCADAGDVEELIKIDEMFHYTIAKSTKNRTLSVLMKTMTKLLHEGWISSLHVPGRAVKTVVEHGRIADAIKHRDPEKAERAMYDHLQNALEDIRASMKKRKDGG